MKTLLLLITFALFLSSCGQHIANPVIQTETEESFIDCVRVPHGTSFICPEVGLAINKNGHLIYAADSLTFLGGDNAEDTGLYFKGESLFYGIHTDGQETWVTITTNSQQQH